MSEVTLIIDIEESFLSFTRRVVKTIRANTVEDVLNSTGRFMVD